MNCIDSVGSNASKLLWKTIKLEHHPRPKSKKRSILLVVVLSIRWYEIKKWANNFSTMHFYSRSKKRKNEKKKKQNGVMSSPSPISSEILPHLSRLRCMSRALCFPLHIHPTLLPFHMTSVLSTSQSPRWMHDEWGP